MGHQGRRTGHARRITMHRLLGSSLLLAALSALVVLITSPGSAAAANTAEKNVPSVLPGLSLATLLSPASASQQMEIGVGVTHPNPAGEQALYDAIYNPASPRYHHFLSTAQFQARFGVSTLTSQAVRAFLTGGGLTITSTSAGGDYFTASGTVAQMEKLFATKIGDYVYKGVRFFANASPPSVPSDLPISGVLGLQNLSHFSVDAANPRARTRPAVTINGTSGTELTYTPQDLWGFYNAPGAAALTNPTTGISDPTTVENSKYTLGQGQIMGVFTDGEDSSVIRNLRMFEAATGLPKVPVRIVETEGGPDSAYSDNSGAVEWYLDSQSSTGMAPDVAQLDLYTSKTFQDPDIAKEFNYWANAANGPREMNASFGECEQTPASPVSNAGPLASLPFGVSTGGEMENMADGALRQAAMEGRTLFASAGDTGSGCPTLALPVLGGGNGLAVQPVPFQEYPCISDYVVCVGGTSPESKAATYPGAATRTAEPAWTYSGGGSSYFNPEPDFQKGVSAINVTCVSNDTGTTVYTPGSAPLCRGVPDVADMSGGGNDWFYFFQDGEPSIEGGTSLASPLMMGQWARTQAAAPAAKQKAGGLGYANPTIYKQAASADTCTTGTCTGTYARDFYDITQGEDIGDAGGQAGAPVSTGVGESNGVYAPSTGWDYVSGWGALNDANFIQDVDGSTDAADPYSGAEQAAANVCKVSMSSPSGNATDPVDFTNDAGADLTGATLSTSGSNIVATVTVPNLSQGPPADAVLGDDFYVGWEYNGVFYYAKAHESASGGFTYSDGSTGPDFDATHVPENGHYTDINTATGSADTSSGLITITVPAADVGAPKAGAALSDPQAFDQVDVTALDITVDSADTIRDWSTDDGQLDSIGVNVIDDGVAGSNCSDTLPATSVASADLGVIPSPASSSTAPAGTKAKFSSAQRGKLVMVHASLPQAASTFYFRWQLGVSFGTAKSLSYIAKEIAVYALPSGKKSALKITQLSKPHGRIDFKLSKGSLSTFSFHLDAKYLYFSHAERAYIKAHHVKSVTGLFEIKSTKGVTYRETLTVKL